MVATEVLTLRIAVHLPVQLVAYSLPLPPTNCFFPLCKIVQWAKFQPLA